MIIDLDAIKARVQALQRHAGGTDYAAQVIRDNVELVAEVERLRADVERLQQMQPKRDYYASLGAAQERAAVVAYLQAASQGWAVDDPLNEAADAIERGEHRRKETE